MVRKLLTVLIIFFVCFAIGAKAQSQDSLEFNKKKFRNATLIGVGAYTASLFVLNEVWYSQSDRQDFTFFNDNAQWYQMDKIGHVYSAYHLSRIMKSILNKSGMPEKKSAYYSALGGFLILSPIEILDGFSASYGASYGDLIANSLGSGLFLGQELLWQEQKIKFQFSFHRSEWAQFNRNLLGKGLHEEFLKDYNGQSYWLSASPTSFMSDKKHWSKWINISFGYSGDQMIFAREKQNLQAGFDPNRQFFFGIDPNLSHIKTNKGFLKFLLFIADGIRIPGPALMLKDQKMSFHPIYF